MTPYYARQLSDNPDDHDHNKIGSMVLQDSHHAHWHLGSLSLPGKTRRRSLQLKFPKIQPAGLAFEHANLLTSGVADNGSLIINFTVSPMSHIFPTLITGRVTLAIWKHEAMATEESLKGCMLR